ncbi:hypothetical protein [Ruegeria arenilitoris]|uniref:hypothetical protein n=1 Tax=Ruegeria arenilitoris TaxID=1173585 RepID=UPI00147F6892|nr:hypothetical protein [Ruegeria arenilitoris]
MNRVENIKLAALVVTIVAGLMAGGSQRDRIGQAEPVMQPVPMVQTFELTG